LQARVATALDLTNEALEPLRADADRWGRKPGDPCFNPLPVVSVERELAALVAESQSSTAETIKAAIAEAHRDMCNTIDSCGTQAGNWKSALSYFRSAFRGARDRLDRQAKDRERGLKTADAIDAEKLAREKMITEKAGKAFDRSAEMGLAAKAKSIESGAANGARKVNGAPSNIPVREPDCPENVWQARLKRYVAKGRITQAEAESAGLAADRFPDDDRPATKIGFTSISNRRANKIIDAINKALGEAAKKADRDFVDDLFLDASRKSWGGRPGRGSCDPSEAELFDWCVEEGTRKLLFDNHGTPQALCLKGSKDTVAEHSWEKFEHTYICLSQAFIDRMRSAYPHVDSYSLHERFKSLAYSHAYRLDKSKYGPGWQEAFEAVFEAETAETNQRIAEREKEERERQARLAEKEREERIRWVADEVPF
jgi:hypothetical protein